MNCNIRMKIFHYFLKKHRQSIRNSERLKNLRGNVENTGKLEALIICSENDEIVNKEIITTREFTITSDGLVKYCSMNSEPRIIR